MRIGIVDYGVGNIANVIRCLEHVATTESIVRVSSHKDIQACDKIVLPGVGAFGSAMEHLVVRGLDESLCEYAKRGRYMLGICVGMQLLFEKSYEFGEYKGLGLVKGFVTPFGSEASIKWHMQTNIDSKNTESKNLSFTSCANTTCDSEVYNSESLDSDVYKNIQTLYTKSNAKENATKGTHLKIPHIGWNKNFIKKSRDLCTSLGDSFYLYFVHSYHVCCNPSFIIATCDYGISFPSIIGQDNILGIQPHPERSHEVGFKLMRNFLQLR